MKVALIRAIRDIHSPRSLSDNQVSKPTPDMWSSSFRCRGACTALVAAFALLAGADQARGQANPAWTTPFPPFHVAGNLYYVGSKDLASYLVATPQGHILINSSLEASVPLIRQSVEQLGFKFTDIKVLLISHAHWDHDAGSALVRKLT